MNNRKQKIFELVSHMNYCDENIVEIIFLIKKEIETEVEKKSTGKYLHNLLQTDKKQLQNLVQENLAEEERRKFFEETKSNFLADLSSLA